MSLRLLRFAVAGLVAAGLVAAGLAGSPARAQENWPDYRGPQGDGHATATDLPLTWSETENLVWKTAIPGRGYSSPVVWGQQVWMTTALEDERSLRAVAVDRASGKVVHDVEVFRPAAWQASHLENSYASPAPVVEEGRVYVHFGTYGTAALDTANGQVRWRNQELQLDHEVGPGSSPILWQDLLIVNCDGTDVRFVAALDKHSGRLVWKSPRSVPLNDSKAPQRKAFSTPLVVEVDGQPQVISPGAGQVSAYEPRTGKEIWRVRYDGYSNVPRPVAGLGMVFVDTGYIRPHLFAIRLGGRGDVTDTHVVWQYYWQVPANPSPLLIDDRLFLLGDWGNSTWLDARKGEDLWRQRLGGRYFASPIYAEGRIYAFGVEGKTQVLAAGDTFEPLAENVLDGGIRASPAVAGRAFYVRTETHLYRIEKAPPKAVNNAAVQGTP